MNTPLTLTLLASLTGCAYQPPTQTTTAAYTAPAMNVQVCHDYLATVAAYITTTSPAIEDCLQHKRGAGGGLGMFVRLKGSTIPFDQASACIRAGYVWDKDPALLLVLKEAPKFNQRVDRIVAMGKGAGA